MTMTLSCESADGLSFDILYYLAVLTQLRKGPGLYLLSPLPASFPRSFIPQPLSSSPWPLVTTAIERVHHA